MSFPSRSSRAGGALVALLATAPALAAQVPAAEFAARRDSLAARVQNGVVVAFGGRTPVTDFGPFHQLNAFHYLTNFDEPDAAFVMVVRDGRAASTLFATPVNPRMAFYYGRRPDSTTAARETGIPTRSFAALAPFVDSLAAASGAPVLAVADVEDADFVHADSLTRGQQFVRALTARHPGLAIRDGTELVDQLRARKSPTELALLRRAAQISSEGHRAAMRLPDPRHEYELQAALESTFLRLGGTRPAYGSIVGAGAHGTQLHYMKDRGPVSPGDLVVMDAATEYEGYAADVTRTIPASGRFTTDQRTIYQLVRDAQAAAERNARPGASYAQVDDSAMAVRVHGLARLGLVESEDALMDPPWPADCDARPKSCRQAVLWTIHGLGHGLGLAVHDPAQYYFGDRTIRPGDAFTIEPGIYISQASLDALPDTPRNRAFVARVRAAVQRYENTGVRIEDDYVATEHGVERVSDAPREVGEIEALMRSRGTRPTP